MAHNPEDSLQKEVAKEMIEQYPNEIENGFSNILNYGCQSGRVNSLVWYSDTRAFYDKYYEEIEELREEYESNIGQPIKIQGDLKNFFAWFAFDETTYKMANDLGIDY